MNIQAADRAIGILVACQMMRRTEALRKEPTPLPFGLAQRYRSFIPAKTPEQIWETDTDPYWCWYAAELQGFISLFDSLPKQEFVAKRKP